MKIKLLEIRDKATLIEMFAFQVSGGDGYLARRAGFGPSMIMLGYLQGGPAHYDCFHWGDRTKQTAHRYIEEHWNVINDGEVIDVEFILGESKVKKISEGIC